MSDWEDLVDEDLEAAWNDALARHRARAKELEAAPDAATLASVAEDMARFALLGKSAGPFAYPYRFVFPALLDATRKAPSPGSCAGVLAFASVQACYGGAVTGMFDSAGRQLLEYERAWLPSLSTRELGVHARLLAFEALASDQPRIASSFSRDEDVERLASALASRTRAPFEDAIRAFPDALEAGRMTWTELMCVARAVVEHVDGRGSSSIGAACPFVRRIAFPPPPPPEPTPVRASDGAFAIRMRDRVVTGKVTSVTELPSWRAWRVDLVGSEVNVTLPVGIAMPFAVGDVIEVRHASWAEGIHPITDACILDAKGEVLAASIDSGDAGGAPGWEISVIASPDDRASTRQGFATSWSRGVRLARHGASILVRDGAWHELHASGEDWLVCGHAIEWASGPGLMLPPDARSYSRYSIIRAASTR